MMEQVQSEESRPQVPPGVNAVAWMILLVSALGLLFYGSLMLTVHEGEVMFRYSGHEYLVGGMLTRALGLGAIVVFFGFDIVSAVFALRGRMWAYYVLFVNSVFAVVSTVLDIVARHVDLLAWLPFVVLWVLLRDFRAFRGYARVRR